jgi:multisubunit Na+/H+ antiporter MnhB subunit
MSWLVIGLVVVSLWGLFLWLGAVFDWITDYYHDYTRAGADPEDSSTAKGKGS